MPEHCLALIFFRVLRSSVQKPVQLLLTVGSLLDKKITKLFWC